MSIKHETITVSGTVIYCDGCNGRGPGTAYDNIDYTIDCALRMGWTQDDNDRDLCDKCSKPKAKRAKK